MLKWKERENEEEYYIFGNDPTTVMALWECGLLKFFKVQGMRAQLVLLEHLVQMWDVNEQAFHVGVHTLTLEIDDIYFLTGLSRHGSRVSLSRSRGGGEPMDYYVAHHCAAGIEKHSGKVSIKDVEDLSLRIILYTITHVVGSAAPHMDLQIHFQYAIECMEPRVFNWCEGLLKNMKKQLTVQDRSIETIQIWIDFGILFPREGPIFAPTTCGLGCTHSTRSSDEEVGRLDGTPWWRANRYIWSCLLPVAERSTRHDQGLCICRDVFLW
jgi:hypothetical protein